MLTEHYVDGHRLAVNIGQPIHYEWKEGNAWRQKLRFLFSGNVA